MGETKITRKFNAVDVAGVSSAYKNFNISPSINTHLNATLEMQYFKAELNDLDTNNLALWKTEDDINWLKIPKKFRKFRKISELKPSFSKCQSIDQ